MLVVCVEHAVQDHGCCKLTLWLYLKCSHSVLRVYMAQFPAYHPAYLPCPADAAFGLNLRRTLIKCWVYTVVKEENAQVSISVGRLKKEITMRLESGTMNQ